MPEALRYPCPTCGSDVEVGKPCPGCAKKAKPGPPKKSWQTDKVPDGLDLPDDDFDYDEFVKKEFSRLPHRSLGQNLLWYLLGIGILITLFAQLIGVF